MPLGANAPRAGLTVASKLGVLLSATGFLAHKLSLHLYVHTQSETQHFSYCEALIECNEALNGYSSRGKRVLLAVSQR